MTSDNTVNERIYMNGPMKLSIALALAASVALAGCGSSNAKPEANAAPKAAAPKARDIHKIEQEVETAIKTQIDPSGTDGYTIKVSCIEKVDHSGARCFGVQGGPYHNEFSPSERIGVTVTYGANGSYFWEADKS